MGLFASNTKQSRGRHRNRRARSKKPADGSEHDATMRRNARAVMAMEYEEAAAVSNQLCAAVLAHYQGLLGMDDITNIHINQTEGTVTFTNQKKGIKATAPVQIIGTWTEADSTWLWAWANPSLQNHLVQNALKMKAYGEKMNIEHLVAPSIGCSYDDMWELGTIACVLSRYQCPYRMATSSSRVLLNFDGLNISKL